MTRAQLRYFSMFSGIGGFEKAIHDVCPGATCVGYSEVNAHAIRVYETHFPTHKNYGDCRTIDPRFLRGLDWLVGGFPCQAFSMAGARRGFADPRGALFAQVVRIARGARPRLLLLENVRGLLSHEQGRTFAAVLTALDAVVPISAIVITPIGSS